MNKVMPKGVWKHLGQKAQWVMFLNEDEAKYFTALFMITLKVLAIIPDSSDVWSDKPYHE